MKPDFEKLIKENNNHSTMLDTDGIIKAMSISFELGHKQGEKKVLEWLSEMSYLSENLNYIIQEYKNQNHD